MSLGGMKHPGIGKDRSRIDKSNKKKRNRKRTEQNQIHVGYIQDIQSDNS